jgi:signal peptidase II
MKVAQIPQVHRARLRHNLLFLGVSALILGLDQATKELVRATLERGEFWPNADWPVRLHYVTNTGAAFGILKDQTGFLILTSVIGLAAILLYYRYPPSDHFLVPIALGMMLGGAVGNLLDRIRLGRVTDFIDFPLWPAFNVADASIVVAVIVLIGAYGPLRPQRSMPTPEPRPPSLDPREDPGADR